MQQKLSELTAAASGGTKVAQALRLLEDLELGLGPSHHINPAMRVQQPAMRRENNNARASKKKEGNKMRRRINKAGAGRYCAGARGGWWRRPRRGGTRPRPAPPSSCNANANATTAPHGTRRGRARQQHVSEPDAPVQRAKGDKRSRRKRHKEGGRRQCWCCARGTTCCLVPSGLLTAYLKR